jgi:hypothetical protein
LITESKTHSCAERERERSLLCYCFADLLRCCSVGLLSYCLCCVARFSASIIVLSLLYCYLCCLCYTATSATSTVLLSLLYCYLCYLYYIAVSALLQLLLFCCAVAYAVLLSLLCCCPCGAAASAVMLPLLCCCLCCAAAFAELCLCSRGIDG